MHPRELRNDGGADRLLDDAWISLSMDGLEGSVERRTGCLSNRGGREIDREVPVPGPPSEIEAQLRWHRPLSVLGRPGIVEEGHRHAVEAERV
jgi:hypothetical protein